MKTTQKIPKTFIGFLIASFFIWLLITFSKEYSTVITCPVNYINIQQDKLLQETPIKQIDIAVKSSGFKLLRSKIYNKTINLESSVLQRKKGSKYYLLVKNQFTKIQKQLKSGIQLQEILQDTIYLNLGLLKSKKVVLKPDLDIKYQIGYALLGDIKVVPDSIVISGPEDQLKKITSLNLKKITLNDLKENFSEEVQIVEQTKGKNLKFSTAKATVSGNVERFTEGRLKIPFITKNLPDHINLTTLSDNVEVVFIVALSNFTKVSEASFTVECDFEISEKNNLSYLIPKVTTKPDFIKSFKIVPTKIDFLIQK
ncbi:YbbR-like protein [Polaribacter sp. KT25b]|uniref:CdaR family protein n=1 Tax=Polaribacter sp. KT25b TaxID=1855336 RepID=UPI00087B933A|nr:YbbR-like domain-containing protein [Polaribacter sp. KT25b]SDR83106.1 YbbR-like protein [Polaribacter sp. KT25b]